MTVRRYVVVEDCGPVINPMIVEGQIHAPSPRVMAKRFGEELVYDPSGQLLTEASWTIRRPRRVTLPSFILGHLETPPRP